MSSNHPVNTISILVPVYNEKDSVVGTLEKIRSTLKHLPIQYEIIAINDKSTDGTQEILDTLHGDDISIIHHPVNRGYGASLKTGIKAATYPWILITDADGTYPIDRIPDLIAHAAHYDMVVGARISDKVHDTIPRMIGRGIVRIFASYVADTDIKDINSGLRIFKKEHAEQFWHLFPERFSFTSTITVASHTHGHKVLYMPIDYYKRAGKSSIKPAKDFTGFMSLIMRLAVYFRPLKVFVPLSLTLFITAWVLLIGGRVIFNEVMDATFAIFIIASLQTLFFGLIAEMIVKRFYND